jgi:aminopeptidase N
MRLLLLLTALFLAKDSTAQLTSAASRFDRMDTLRGSVGPYRAWWNVTYYDISIKPDLTARQIQGTTIIAFTATAEGQRMQIDLQEPLTVDSITVEVTSFKDGMMVIGDRAVDHSREKNVIWVDLPEKMRAGEATTLRIHYHGTPRAARNAPWDGGWVWTQDRSGAPWASVACQGLGASVWFPCKDHQGDEPEDGASLHITVPDTLVGVGNGRLKDQTRNRDGTSTWNWQVKSPINSYNIIPYIGKYTMFEENFAGAEGELDLQYWILKEDEAKAREHFKQVPGMMKCFEEYLGPFPWYNDGFKLVQAPYLGMEHQSAIAYGNDFKMGYRGMDLSHSGYGNRFDYIIVHETGHEWFGNSITTADIADMWIHEGFTVYTEVAYVECMFGKDAANQYALGMRGNIVNDRPVIGPHGVNEEGSGDMYYKGAAVIHMVRAIMNDDEKFWGMIRDLGTTFKHSIVTSEQIEDHMDQGVDQDLNVFFDQYLRTTRVPVLEWKIEKKRLSYRWAGSLPGFQMPVDVQLGNDRIRLEPTGEWQKFDRKVKRRTEVVVDPRYYVESRKLEQ